MAQLFMVGLWTVVFSLGRSLMGVEGLTAHATFYGGSDAAGTNTGACGYNNVLSMGYGTMMAALSSPLFKEGKSFGSCYNLRCSGSDVHGCTQNEIVVTATNLGPEGSVGGWCNNKPHFELTQTAFSQIAKPASSGVVEVVYEKVTCERKGGIHFLLVGHTNFLQVLIHNVGGCSDIASVSVKGGNGPWIPMTRSWGQLWQTGEILDGQTLSFSVTMGDGKTCVSNNVAGANWKVRSHIRRCTVIEQQLINRPLCDSVARLKSPVSNRPLYLSEALV